MHEVLVNRFGGLSLPRKSLVRLTDRPDMTIDVYCGRKNNNTTATTSFANISSGKLKVKVTYEGQTIKWS